MMLDVSVKTQFADGVLKQKLQAATFRSLRHAGGAIRLTARRSIRRRKKPSQRGQAPSTPTGHLKRVIRYHVNEHQSEVVIGPTNEYARTIWNLHEFGGITRPHKKLLKVPQFAVGDYGPVRRDARPQSKQGKKTPQRRQSLFVRAKLRTAAQAIRATRLIEEENTLRTASSMQQRRYPKRPFMGPALDKQRDRLPKFWANSVKA